MKQHNNTTPYWDIIKPIRTDHIYWLLPRIIRDSVDSGFDFSEMNESLYGHYETSNFRTCIKDAIRQELYNT